ncbi:hypothetical protein OG800_09230 [Streptomyces sp. NBC_00445]|uniref:hypothetical protein n=1 Tax=Streptomyces sp. NBC_00445 TaxID=2975745 RepID=UPI002E22A1E6
MGPARPRPSRRGRTTSALRFFRDSGEAYNTARTLTDLAETRLDGDEFEAALPLIEEVLAALEGENAAYHVAHLRGLRERCVTPQ